MRDLRAMRLVAPVPPPTTLDWISGLPVDLQMFLNDSLGDCTIAGIYHSILVWLFLANPPTDLGSNTNVQLMYEKICGYVPGKPSTDQGGAEQDVLTYWLNQGVPTAAGINKLLAFVEADPQNINGIKWGINDCGIVYIGFQLPKSFLDALDSGVVPDVWDIVPNDTLTNKGHCVILVPKYDENKVSLISWGRLYEMTWNMFKFCVDEAYPLASKDWITAKGTSPGAEGGEGLTVAQLEEKMQGLKEN